MSAAETPRAGHVIVPSGPLRGVTGVGWAVPSRAEEVVIFTTAIAPAQTSATTIARIAQRA
jgi:hypothetical protein